MTKKAIVLMADDFEDVEAITPIDYLKRAGIEVTTVSISQNLVVKSRWGEIQLIADTSINELPKKQDIGIFDAVIIPGGMPGAANIAASEKAGNLIKNMAAAGKLICAICASPVVVLYPLGLIKGKKFTCFSGLEEKAPKGKWQDCRVVTDGNIITSRAAGTSGEFAIAIIEKLLDKEAGEKIAKTVMLV
ncbi:MAG: DJ-1/PfpI family protein [Treponema sp.]|nr:DJ-1/PfpI family protein [Treponema sp.]